jgi:hypothetical protein
MILIWRTFCYVVYVLQNIKVSLMRTLKSNLRFTPLTVAAAIALAMSTTASASVLDTVSKAVKDSETKLQLRYRMETVDQKGVDKNASASTLKTRLTWASGSMDGFKLNVEVDNVTAFGDNYNSTSNSQTAYPVVADPTGTDVNQANIAYTGDSLNAVAGRQRILHDNQRFVGGVGWRQNEQTYDGYRIQYKFNDALNFDYAYVYNVNRIFGPTGAKADLHGSLHLMNTTYAINKNHKLGLFRYALDFDSALAATDSSSSTLGLKYSGKLDQLSFNATYANQSDYKGNLNNYSASYLGLEAAYQFEGFKILGGYESLGSDNGVGFTTPLATLHKFQGFADKFLGTPALGIEDTYFTVAGAISGVKLSATMHSFSTDVGGADLGSELDLVAKYKVNKNLSVLAKYASYDADMHQTDTDKFWLMATMNF